MALSVASAQPADRNVKDVNAHTNHDDGVLTGHEAGLC
jgi:hypothetical protein